MAEGARLESACTGNRTGGSNPPLSARIKKPAAFAAGFFVNDRVELARTREVAKKPDGAPRPAQSPWQRAGAPRWSNPTNQKSSLTRATSARNRAREHLMAPVAAGHFLAVPTDAIVHAFSAQNAGGVFFDTG